VEGFQAIVTMVSHVKLLHAGMAEASGAILAKLANPVF
jgi:hypothetical protein